MPPATNLKSPQERQTLPLGKKKKESHEISEISRATNLQFSQERQALPLAKSHTWPYVNFNQKTNFKFYQVHQASAWSSKQRATARNMYYPVPKQGCS